MCAALAAAAAAAAAVGQAKVDRVRGINLRITRKRPLSALTWALAPGLKIGVQVRELRAQLLTLPSP